MEYIAHIRESDKQVQTVTNHLKEVQELAEIYGETLGLKHLTGLAGILHDLGKFSKQFQTYIIEAVNNPDKPPKKGSVDHSTVGGKVLFEFYHNNGIAGILAEIVGNAIISHHSYLHDFLSPDLDSNYLKRVNQKVIDKFEETVQIFYEEVMSKKELSNYIDKATDELENFLKKDQVVNFQEKLMFLTKFIFSALIDADRTNTRLFEENHTFLQNQQPQFDSYYQKLMTKLASFRNVSPIDKLRSDMSNQCDQFAEKPSGIYTLSIPTGGGKTLASLRYAIKHAKLYNKKRIIYVVPYTTIIEQNAEEVRQILNDEANILEHHSNILDDDFDDEDQTGKNSIKQKLKLAKDNWDSPVIFTTMVQFLNVFYAKGSRYIRRLHNLEESVIIFDEVQKVPISCVSMFNMALNFLKNNMKSSIVLCTATQPALDYVENQLEMNPEAEMIKDLDKVIHQFKRVDIVDKTTEGPHDNSSLSNFVVDKVNEVQSVLIILNTKTVVRNLYEELKTKEIGIPIYHLSTSMCPAHRNVMLKKIRKHLDNDERIICLSTQLIEAGVDVSFDCVIRSLAGLDSIAQAAGRCNRHGRHNIQKVYCIDHKEENLNHLKEIQSGKEIAKRILVDIKNDPNLHGGDLLSREAMNRYFLEFYSKFESDLNYNIPEVHQNMTDLLIDSQKNQDSYRNNKGQNFPLFLANSYRTAADYFQVIKNPTTSVIVPYGEGKEIIAELNSLRTIDELTQLLKKAQQYTINLYNYERDTLSGNDGLVSYLDGSIYALVDTFYDEEFGFNLKGDSLKPHLF